MSHVSWPFCPGVNLPSCCFLFFSRWCCSGFKLWSPVGDTLFFHGSTCSELSHKACDCGTYPLLPRATMRHCSPQVGVMAQQVPNSPKKALSMLQHVEPLEGWAQHWGASVLHLSAYSSRTLTLASSTICGTPARRSGRL